MSAPCCLAASLAAQYTCRGGQATCRQISAQLGAVVHAAGQHARVLEAMYQRPPAVLLAWWFWTRAINLPPGCASWQVSSGPCYSALLMSASQRAVKPQGGRAWVVLLALRLCTL